MPRITPIDPAAASGPVKAQLDGTARALGGTPNLFLTAAHSPAALTAMNAFFGALGKGALGGKIGERVAIAVAQQNGCEYCLGRTRHSVPATAWPLSNSRLPGRAGPRMPGPRPP
jgi:alkylhydroperoxidase family enzyme